MMQHDEFSRWLGIQVLEVAEGSCKIQMTTRQEMLNGFGIIHGGVTASFADSALAFASNGYNRIAVALEISVSFTTSAKVGDTLTAVAAEVHRSNKIAVYDIRVTNQRDEVVSVFKGTVYRTSRTLFETQA